MVRWSRYAFAAITWLFVLGVVVQTLYAGLGFFSAEGFEVHVTLGYLLHLVPILVIATAALGRAGRTTLLWCLALLVSVGVQPFLPALRDSVPLLAALHPVNALLIFGIAVVLAMRSLDLVREAPGTQGPGEAS